MHLPSRQSPPPPKKKKKKKNHSSPLIIWIKWVGVWSSHTSSYILSGRKKEEVQSPDIIISYIVLSNTIILSWMLTFKAYYNGFVQANMMKCKDTSMRTNMNVSSEVVRWLLSSQAIVPFLPASQARHSWLVIWLQAIDLKRGYSLKTKQFVSSQKGKASKWENHCGGRQTESESQNVVG